MDGAEPVRLHAIPGAPADAPDLRSMWHITLTVAGQTVPAQVIKGALERLSYEHPFLLSGRYAADRAEVRYWEEATDVATALRMAVLLWDEHVASAQVRPKAAEQAGRQFDRGDSVDASLLLATGAHGYSETEWLSDICDRLWTCLHKLTAIGRKSFSCSRFLPRSIERFPAPSGAAQCLRASARRWRNRRCCVVC